LVLAAQQFLVHLSDQHLEILGHLAGQVVQWGLRILLGLVSLGLLVDLVGQWHQ
jgi:hypothetical protein